MIALMEMPMLTRLMRQENIVSSSKRLDNFLPKLGHLFQLSDKAPWYIDQFRSPCPTDFENKWRFIRGKVDEGWVK